MIKKVLIANRGEIALRVIRACKELGLKTVSVHSNADEQSLHRFFSDEDVCIGEARSTESYLNIARVIAAAEITGADAIHPGYGFLSERAEFSEACKENNINFIGASKEIINMMGDKSSARQTMKKAGVPIIQGTEILATKDEAKKAAKTIKYPVILKATAGGGGKGMRICRSDEELDQNFDVARREAEANFGNPGVYMEKYIEGPHHIEVQILADAHGNVVHLGERDCSIQRKHQKLVEETPSPFISEKLRKEIREAAVKGCREVGYVGAGTIEFLVDSNMDFFFMEMNTRIQVEHTISELYTGIDLVKQQIRVADGEKLPYKQEDIIFRGHVIECRINAEDPYNGFIPNPGKIQGYHLPQGLGVRVDSHCYADYEIPPFYDSMIAKLIVWGHDREEAIARMKRSLDEFVIEGVKTTIPFHRQLMEDKAFTDGKYDTHFLATFKMKD
jgi:acetyl-CoA carboxylase, biotin carboxylase subunit